MDLLMASGIFAVVFVLVLLLLTRPGNDAEQEREVVRRMTRPEEDAEVRITRKRRSEGSDFFKTISQFNVLRSLEEQMWQAGIYSRVSDVLLIMVLLFGAGFAGVNAAWGGGFWIPMAGGAGLGMIPVVYIRVRRTRRLKAFGRQLPFALDLIKSSLEAGHSLQRGLQVVVSEFKEPLGAEFRTLLEQNRIGLPLPRALDEMLKRVPDNDLRLLSVAVKVQSEVGSSLAQIVGRLAEIVRTRQRLGMQIRALTAQSRLGGWVVGVLPIVVLLVFSIIQPGYTDALFYDPSGQKILKVAAGLDLAAILIIRRLLKVDF